MAIHLTRRLLAGFMLGTCSVAAMAGGSDLATVLPMEPYRKTVALRAEVHGKSGLFVFDTGSGITALTPSYAEKIGCKPWGRMTGYNMMGTRVDAPRCDGTTLSMQGYASPPLEAAVLDVMSFYPKDARPVDGIIGLDSFAGKVVTLDFAAGKIVLESPASLSKRIAGLHELPMRIGRELQGRALAVYAGVPSPSGVLWMELDSGNGGTVLISKIHAKDFGMNPEAQGPQSLMVDIAPGLPLRTASAFAPADMIFDGNLGMPFLKDKVVTMDLAAGRLWITTAVEDTQRSNPMP